MVREILVYHNSAASGLVHGALAEKKKKTYTTMQIQLIGTRQFREFNIKTRSISSVVYYNGFAFGS